MPRGAHYPSVLGEFETMQAVASGKSIARYGDGEFKMCTGAGIKSQDHHPVLQTRLREILKDSGDCLVGIPNIHTKERWEDERGNPFSGTPKKDFWAPFTRFTYLLTDREYVSSFITRPDSAPWINRKDYWALLESLWKDQDVTLVRGSGKSFTAERLMLAGAKRVHEVIQQPGYNGRPQHAFAQYDDLVKRIGTPERALLCLGPTATVLAVDLCAKGVHAIDLGHMGMFYQKHVNGVPVVVTPEDRMLPA